MPAFDHNAFLKNLTSQPGVYRMYNEQGDVIYVGKAKNLKNRVSSYFRKNVDNAKTRSLVANIASMDVTVVNRQLLVDAAERCPDNGVVVRCVANVSRPVRLRAA